MEDVCGYTQLAQAKSFTLKFTARQLVAWCAAFGALKTMMSENLKYFNFGTVRRAASALQIQAQLSVANSACTNDTIKLMMRTPKAIVNERGLPLSEWITVLPSVELGVGYCGATPFPDITLSRFAAKRALSFVALVKKDKLELTD